MKNGKTQEEKKTREATKKKKKKKAREGEVKEARIVKEGRGASGAPRH